MIVRVASLIVSSSHDIYAIHCHALLWNHPIYLWVGCIEFYTWIPLFHYLG